MSKRVKPAKKIAFNPIEGQFDLVTDNNWSYLNVPENKKLLIYDNMQMNVHGCFEVDGELRIEGDLTVED